LRSKEFEVKEFIAIVESFSKVQTFMSLAFDKSNNSSANSMDECEWETKTISSAVKKFLCNLDEPLMTSALRDDFINAAKMDDFEECVQLIHYYVYKLPELNKRLLDMIIRHLRLVADHSDKNLMTASNLAVCFGPTLLRPDVKSNGLCILVIEVLITNCERIFDSLPFNQIEKFSATIELNNRVSNVPGDDDPHSYSFLSGDLMFDLTPLMRMAESFSFPQTEVPESTATVYSLPHRSKSAAMKSVRIKHSPPPRVKYIRKQSPSNRESQFDLEEVVVESQGSGSSRMSGFWS